MSSPLSIKKIYFLSLILIFISAAVILFNPVPSRAANQGCPTPNQTRCNSEVAGWIQTCENCDSDPENEWCNTTDCSQAGQTCANGSCQGMVSACVITDAYWNMANATDGQAVKLIITGSNCVGKQVNFFVAEDDLFSGDDPAVAQPASAAFINNIATTNWTAEYQPDGFFGLNDPPEFYFTASLVSDPNINKNSKNNSLLSVFETGGTPEICDGTDNDHNSQTDEGCDADGDHYCACNQTFAYGSNLTNTCSGTNTTNAAAVANTCDCDENSAGINRGAAENCTDGIDNNCDGKIDANDPGCQSAVIPYFKTINGHQVLMVNNKPFLLLGAEGKCSCDNTSYNFKQLILDDLVWAASNNFNVYKANVSWKWLEPTEDNYDFSFIDQVISTARSNNIKIHLVYVGFNRGGGGGWFPDYIRNDNVKYQPVLYSNGSIATTGSNYYIQLSACDNDTLAREKKMFEALTAHIKSIDSNFSTVIAIQVENEVGVSKTSRSFDSDCNSLKQLPQHAARSDEEFYAWTIANYIETLASAGKAIYNIPLNLNTWPVGSNYYAHPDKYKQLYLNTASHIDLIGADLYETSTASMSGKLNNYLVGRNILYLAETTTSYDKSAEFFIYQVLGQFGGIGQSAWSVSDSYNPSGLTSYRNGSQAGKEVIQAYKAINDAMAPIATYQTTSNLGWFIPNAAISTAVSVNGQSIPVTTSTYQGKGMIIQPAQGFMDFTLVGNNFTVNLPDLSAGKTIVAEKGKWDDTIWISDYNVAFTKSGGNIIITMPESCAVRVYINPA